MEPHDNLVRFPESTDRVYKKECCISFDTPKSEGGLFVDMNSFLAFGKDCVGLNYKKSGNTVYLHITETRKPIDPVSKDMPFKKRALPATGVNRRFDNSDSEYEENYEIVILPDYVTLPFPCDELPEQLISAVDAVILNVGAEKRHEFAMWNFDDAYSKHAFGLKQLDNGVTIPPSGWKCKKCDQTNNLWLNLIDGSILCGRGEGHKIADISCATSHFEATGYPFFVNIETITADLYAAVVYSFLDKRNVMYPLLHQHLQHFGLCYLSLKKTGVAIAERELTKNTKFDWDYIQECGQELEPLHGPEYTGLVNLGNSSYLASVMQVMLSTRSFYLRYYSNQSLKASFRTAPDDPTSDLNMQLTKLAHGLMSGKYSSSESNGIPPRMFKSAISVRNPEFARVEPQDALNFFEHLMAQVEQSSSKNLSKPDPSRSFKFGVENRYQHPSGRVTYETKIHHFLSLDIPLDKATNQKALGKLKVGTSSSVDELSIKVIRPRVPFLDCLNCFVAPREVPNRGTKTSSLISFPNYLVIHMEKFLEEGRHKIDAFIDVPHTIDISHMRYDINTRLVQEQNIDPLKVKTLIAFGFKEEIARKALVASGGDILDAADWISKERALDERLKSLPLPDGSGKYRLIGFVSHIGPSDMNGKYVAHIYKDREKKWAIFNDEQVAVSKNPPTDMGYLYFFEGVSRTMPADDLLPDIFKSPATKEGNAGRDAAAAKKNTSTKTAVDDGLS